MKVLLISANQATTPYPVYPIGMSVVANALKQAGHDVELFDFLQNNCSLGALQQVVSSVQAAVVGISIRNIDNVNAAHEQRYIDSVRQIVRSIREVTTAKIILGGSGYSIMPQEILSRVGADYGVVGEGEVLICDFVEAVSSGDLPQERILRAEPGLGMDTMNGAYYDPGILAYYKNHGNVISIQTKRGCTRHCIYCSYPVLEGHKLRMREATAVVDDIERSISEHQAERIYFVDSVFNDSEGLYRELIQEMANRRIKIPWTAFFSPGGELDDEIVAQMKATGLDEAELGADAACDTTLKALGKGFAWKNVVACNELFHRYDVTTAHCFMFGGPGETQETVIQGIKNIRNLEQTANFIFMGIRILPGTGLMTIARREGLVTDEMDIIEPVYYFSKHIDRDWLESRLTEGFADRINCVFPPDALDNSLLRLHQRGFRGMPYRLLVNADERNYGVQKKYKLN